MATTDFVSGRITRIDITSGGCSIKLHADDAALRNIPFPLRKGETWFETIYAAILLASSHGWKVIVGLDSPPTSSNPGINYLRIDL